MTQEQKALEVPQRLYESEINGEVSWFFDGGFEWSLYGAKGTIGSAGTYAGALTALAEAACKRFPNGPFAKWWREK